MIEKGLSKEEMDFVTEALSIGAGNAATALSQMLGCNVELSVQKVRFLSPEEVPSIVEDPSLPAIVAKVGFVGDMKGGSYYIVKEVDVKELIPLIEKTFPVDEKAGIVEVPIIEETANIVTGVSFSALGNFCGLNVNQTIPVVTSTTLQALTDEFKGTGDQLKGMELIAIINELTVAERRIVTYLLMALSEDSIKILSLKIAEARKKLEIKGLEEKVAQRTLELQTVVETAGDAIISMKPPGDISLWNRKAEEMFRYLAGEVIGKDLHSLIVPERHREKARDGYRAFFQTGTGPVVGKTIEIEALRKDGTEFHVELSVSAMNIKGEWHSTGIVRDITERKQAEGALECAKKEWEATFDAISDPLFIHDKDMRLVRSNSAYLTASGEAEFRDIIGRPYYEVFPKMDGPFKMCLKAQELQEEEEEFHYINKVFKVRFYPIKDVAGSYLYSIHILEDITEAKKAEERIKEEIDITSHLLMISEATSGMTDIDKLIKEVVHCSQEVLGCDICLAYLWNNEERLFMPVHARELPHHLTSIFMTEPIKEKDFLKGINLSFKEIFSWSRELTVGSVVSLPLTARNEYLGLIIGIFSNKVELSDRHMKVVNGISHQVGVALEEAKLYRESVDKTMELSHRIETIQAMHEIDRSILSTLEPQEILETAVRQVGKVASCDCAAVVLVDKENKAFTFAAGFGLNVISNGATIGFEDTNLTDVLRTGRTIYIPNLMEIGELPAFEKKGTQDGIISQLRIPLAVKEEIVGILTVCSRRPAAFTPQDLSALEKIASQIGVALQNARQLNPKTAFTLRGIV